MDEVQKNSEKYIHYIGQEDGVQTPIVIKVDSEVKVKCPVSVKAVPFDKMSENVGYSKDNEGKVQNNQNAVEVNQAENNDPYTWNVTMKGENSLKMYQGGEDGDTSAAWVALAIDVSEFIGESDEIFYSFDPKEVDQKYDDSDNDYVLAEAYNDGKSIVLWLQLERDSEKDRDITLYVKEAGEKILPIHITVDKEIQIEAAE